MIARPLIALGLLIAFAGCSRSHLQVQVLGQNGEPIPDVVVRAEGGPYFADVRGLFGLYKDEARTRSDGIADLKLRIPYECNLDLDLPGYAFWLARADRSEGINSPDFMPIEPFRGRKRTDMTDVQSLTVWIRIRD